VRDVTAWSRLSDVREGAVIGRLTAEDTLVTARIPVKRIEALRNDENVVSLKAAQTIYPSLTQTVRELGVRPAVGPGVQDAQGGSGVVIGIVDFGCDFAHANFVDENGDSRIELIWDQSASPRPDSPYGYGRVHTRAQIGAALQADDPYEALGYQPNAGAHGTHVMDIACGNGRGTAVAGCAPRADIIFVDVAASRLSGGHEVVEASFGDSVQVLEAVHFIFERAGGRPCVVNLSVGTNGGPHDGTTLVEQGLDLLVRGGPNRAVVISAANFHDDDLHTIVHVPGSGQADIEWITRNGRCGHEMEIWMPGTSRVAVELFEPSGASFGVVEPAGTLSLSGESDVSIFVSNRLDDPNNHDNCIGIFLAGGLDGGTWRVRLHSRGVDAVTGHAWIELSDGAQSCFARPVRSHTLGSISCGHESIVVGSFNAHKPGLPISVFSSGGPTRDGREKPEISAPGQFVLAADARSGTGAYRQSGTSMAAPAVTGLLALLLSAARRRGESLGTGEIRERLIKAARRNPPSGQAWEPRMGYGRAFASLVAAEATDSASPPSSVEPPAAAWAMNGE
jgi:subtilisin family serine protease